MNRRDFVKVLAGISLLGLLVKVPRANEQAPTFNDEGCFEAAYTELRSGAERQPPYAVTVAEPLSLPDLGITEDSGGRAIFYFK